MQPAPVIVLSRIHGILDQLGSTLDLPLVLDQVVGCLSECLNAPVAAIALANQDAPPMIAASHGLAPWHQALIESTSDSPEHACLQSGRTSACDALWPRVVPFPFQSGRLVPLVTKGRLTGVLSLYWTQRPDLPEDAHPFLDCVAQLIAMSVHHADLLIRSTLWQVELEAEVERRTAELKAANQKLEHLDAMKADFVSGVTHELRTPITTIKTLIRFMQKHPDTPKSTAYLRVIDQECNRQMGLVEDLLELAHVQVKPGPLLISPVQLEEVVFECCAPHQANAEAKGVRLLTTVQQGQVVPSNRHALSQIISNLLSNAVKFTASGGEVRLEVARAANRLTIRVQDTGTGIDLADLPYIFDRFFRGRQNGSAKGTGLGLALVKQNVDRLGGQIAVKSQADLGSLFEIVLPLEETCVHDLVG